MIQENWLFQFPASYTTLSVLHVVLINLSFPFSKLAGRKVQSGNKGPRSSCYSVKTPDTDEPWKNTTSNYDMTIQGKLGNDVFQDCAWDAINLETIKTGICWSKRSPFIMFSTELVDLELKIWKSVLLLG